MTDLIDLIKNSFARKKNLFFQRMNKKTPFLERKDRKYYQKNLIFFFFWVTEVPG